MASEDSDQFLSWFLMVHRLHDGGDSSHTLVGALYADRTQIHASFELDEIISLAGP
jgi:hypothetical protein